MLVMQRITPPDGASHLYLILRVNNIYIFISDVSRLVDNLLVVR